MRLRQPIWPRFLPTSLVLSLARVGPFGRMRKAPGTWGSLAGLVYQLIIFHYQSWLTVVLFSLIVLTLASGEKSQRGLWLALGLVPLIRIVSIALPVMLTGHLLVAGPVEAIVTGGILAYLSESVIYRRRLCCGDVTSIRLVYRCGAAHDTTLYSGVPVPVPF